MIQQSKFTLVSNAIAFIGTYLISILGVVLVSIGLYNIWIGDTEGFILFIPGVVILIIGYIYNKLLRKWID